MRSWYFLILIQCFSCIQLEDSDFSVPDCERRSNTIIGFNELKEYYKGETIQILEELAIEGYVISSDREGNFFGEVYIQDRATDPEHGIKLVMDLRDTYLLYDTGTKVTVLLKDLYLGKSDDEYAIGGVFSSFGNLYVNRLPARKATQQIVPNCDEKLEIKPHNVQIPDINDAMIGTLLQLPDVEFLEEELGLSFALAQEETKRTLKDCWGNTLTLLNSGYADFQAEPIPDGSGTVTGVLKKDGTAYQLVIRDLKDIEFEDRRCVDRKDEFSSDQLFFSELADPNNNAKARFIELYNSDSEALDLQGWKIRRYTNDNRGISSETSLSGMIIGPETALVIAADAAEFKQIYGFEPDMEAGLNSPADSNGDDNMELIDPLGNRIDIFGFIGEDGSGTQHEFEDGRAIRKPGINKGNSVFSFDEWTVYNDTGAEGTIKLPQNAPEDFSPGIR
ncbi:DUF5689 domain-containing protein [Poritiphilus flavus]|uniref:Lamin tail domain-containing protein n=1 Tax=Poritiphilus flavus TaxID=2697053 RepID=A0A6L9ED14_9FLAO|nr:DUF5689 domain-containing protein [Poritiphilus flavus]NAS12576.1 lamin tail domain-containing protein [Poritiphilus flavus]